MLELFNRYIRSMKASLLLAPLFFFATTIAANTAPFSTIVTPQNSLTAADQFDDYFSQLLHLALLKTELTDGKFLLHAHPIWYSDKRRLTALTEGKIDVLWSNTSSELENSAQAIKIPLLKNLNDYRLLLIRKEDQALFSQINTVEDLRKLKGGMNPQWPDFAVMKANQLPLVTSVAYESFFNMLAAKRFDYFSRGIYQIQIEADSHTHLNLVIAEHLMLSYPSGFYFFVDKKNKKLAQRIERGLHAAIEDGSFDTLFYSFPKYRWGMEQVNNPQRKVIDLSIHE